MIVTSNLIMQEETLAPFFSQLAAASENKSSSGPAFFVGAGGSIPFPGLIFFCSLHLCSILCRDARCSVADKMLPVFVSTEKVTAFHEATARLTA